LFGKPAEGEKKDGAAAAPAGGLFGAKPEEKKDATSAFGMLFSPPILLAHLFVQAQRPRVATLPLPLHPPQC